MVQTHFQMTQHNGATKTATDLEATLMEMRQMIVLVQREHQAWA
jgi:hypothetical protein